MKPRTIILAAYASMGIYAGLLWLAGPLLLMLTAVVCFVGCIVYIARLERRPISDTERQCALDDAELIRREQELKRAAQAGAQSMQWGGGFRAR